MRLTTALAPYYTNLKLDDLTTEQLVAKVGAQLGAVEEIIDVGARYQGVIIARVVACEDHPNADRLHVCKLDDGGQAENVERDDDGYVQVVCGAPNVRKDLRVAWLPPGSTVPESYDKDPFVLEARPLRGVVSNGMLASPKELSLSDNHDGILEIDEDVAPGTSFIEAFDLNEQILDIENKMFTHRPDCFGVLGIYRELAGITGQRFEGPDWYAQEDASLSERQSDKLPLTVRNELPDLVPRFTAVVLDSITVKPSPVWMQVSLMRAGIRPINNIVDITNYYMYLTGQPLHAYDYDKVLAQDTDASQATLVVRYPQESEQIALLNGKTITPRPEAIMIATNDKLIGVGGVMGGTETEVDDQTTRIILECATFDMYSIRRTSMAHGLFTDAVTRFNKGQSPLQTKRVLTKAVDEMRSLAGAKVAGTLIDDLHLDEQVVNRQSLHAPVQLGVDFINVRLGLDLPIDTMKTLLTNVEFKVETEGDKLTVTAPFWRTDIEIAEDVVEEIGRLYGFDHLPLELPLRDVTPTPKDPILDFKASLRRYASMAGANEILTYSFVHGNLLQKVGQDPKQAFQLSNALSPDLQYFRLNVLPSVMERVSPNLKAGHDEFALFEIGKNHTLLHQDDDGDLPTEFEMLALVYAANDKQQKPGAAFYQARTFLAFIAEHLGIELRFSPIEDMPDVPVAKPYDPARSAFVSVRGTDHFLGIIGEFKASVRKGLKLPVQTAGFEVGVRELMTAPRTAGNYVALPRFPKIEQDICLKVPLGTSYDTVYDFVQQHLWTHMPGQCLPRLTPVDIYQREDDPDHRQITLRFSLASYERTLTDDEVSRMLAAVAETAKEALSAERI